MSTYAVLDPVAPPPEAGDPELVHPGRRGRPISEWMGLAALLAVTATAYMWNLTSSGWANSFYAAAVEAGTKSWKAFFFGSLDSSNFITVDKPPASLWVMELSGRLFGFSSASMLVPQVVEGVLTVALVYSVVRRWFGHRPGLLAGVVMATTPVAALMFRFNNPDALLVLLMTAAAYCVTRAVEDGKGRWLYLAGAALGFAFLAKMGQALLVVPGLAGAYLLASPATLSRRLLHLAGAGAALVLAAGWWVLAVTLWPASDRPMIDGSRTNSIWNLIVGYNGLDRVVSSGGAGGGGNFSGATGALRLFNDLMGSQASWLLPAALVCLLVGIIVTARRPRTDRTRAALVLWGGWLIATALVFSFGQGVIHTYYTVALAPAIAVLVGAGAAMAGSRWASPVTRLIVAGVVSISAWWAYALLDRAATWESWLRPAIAVSAVGADAGLIISLLVTATGVRRLIVGTALGLAVIAGLGGPTAYVLETISTAHTGSIPSAGPASVASLGGAGGGPGSGRGGPTGASGGSAPTGASGGSGPTGASGGSASGGSGPTGASGRSAPNGSTGPGRPTSSTNGAPSSAGGGAGGAGGASVSAALVAALEKDASHYRWVAATDGSQNAASLELATGGDPVMAIGGFNGQGGNLSLAQFEKYVAAGDIHFFVVSGSGGGPGGGSSSSAITAWVEAHFESETIGGTTVYNLTEAR